MPALCAKLDGCVTKAPLLFAPALAHAGELQQYVTYKLHEHGFVVVRTEQRVLNAEMADKLHAMDDDYVNNGIADSGATTATAAAAATCAHSSASAAQLCHALVGHVHVMMLASTDCHARLVDVLHTLRTRDEMYQRLVRDALAQHASVTSEDEGNGAALVWTSRTAAGARRVVGLLFPRMLAHNVPTPAQSREYVQAHLKSALVPALTELCAAKPHEPLRWLAEFLLEHNVQPPPMRSVAPAP